MKGPRSKVRPSSVSALLDDARLGAGDVGHGRAQHSGVIQPDGGEYRDLRTRDHIGGVKFAAETHLQHYDVALPAGKILQRNGGDELELRGQILHPVGKGADLVHDLLQHDIRYLLPVHPDALIEAVQIGRGIESGAVARLTEHTLNKGGSTPLAVGTADMDKFQPPLRVAQMLQQGLRARKPRLLAPPLDGVYVCQCGFVTHRSVLSVHQRHKSRRFQQHYTSTARDAQGERRPPRRAGRRTHLCVIPPVPPRTALFHSGQAAVRPQYGHFRAENAVMARLPGGIFVHTFQ